MKKIFMITAILLFASTYLNAKEKCRDLPGYKKIGKNSADVMACLKNSKTLKLNTDSKVVDWIKGKEKIKIPNPLNGLKKVGKAIKPSVLDKK